MAKAKTHRVILRVRFDRPCTATEAVAMVRDTVHGEFYPNLARDKAPESYVVRAVTRAPKREG